MRVKRLVSITAGLAFAGVAMIAVNAQESSPAPSPAPGEAALGGYCPVAYSMMDKAMEGDAQHQSEYEGKTYYLSNAEAKEMFDAAPEKYVPAYDGWCAAAMAQGMKLESDPTLFTVHEGRVYLFSKPDAKAMFDKDMAGMVAKADANWPKLSEESN